MAKLQGKVQTVLGLIDPSDLGITLPHEQPLVDNRGLLRKPMYGSRPLEDMDFRMENLGKIRQFPYSVRSNLLVDNEEEVISELKLYKEAGGGTLCDISASEVRVKSELLPHVSQESGLHIVVGTAFYVDPLQSEESRQLGVREKADFMVKEILHGIGDSGVKCGIIGEVGCSWPLADSEKRTLQAAALAQQETGAPLMIHPGPNEWAPFQILDILEAAGADVSHTVIGHLDRTIFSGDKLLDLAKRGSYLEFDLFGIECSHYQLSLQKPGEIDYPSDAQRIRLVKVLVDGGYAHRVLLSQDIHTKHRQVRYGGHGYAHILEHIVPKMVDRGISRDTVMEMLTENPKKWLTFV